jgi:preprotein translocase subunit Sec63
MISGNLKSIKIAKTYYEILEVDSLASQEDIKKAYYKVRDLRDCQSDR